MKLDLMFAANDRYMVILAPALASIRDSRADDDDITVHVLGLDVTPRHEQMMRALEDSRFRILFYDVSEGLQTIKEMGLPPFKGNWMTYARLLCARYLPADVRRVLYLDCDVLVQGSLGELFEMDMAGNAVAAAGDIVPLEYINAINGGATLRYFNAGILLIDMTLWRENDTERGLLNKFEENKMCYHYADQDILNLYFAGSCLRLPMRYCIFHPVYHWPYKHIKVMRGGG